MTTNDYICGTCKYCGCCDKQDELDFYDLNVCDDWTDDNETDDIEAQRTDAAERENHRREVEGEIE